MQNKEVLLSISNLKQYFPLKRGRVVKANDGVSIDIYKGETFGLVGESGCGKSTLGRTILQLYHQTYGRTMYYGRTLDDLAPKYVYNTIKHLPKLRLQWKELCAKRDKLEQEYAALSEEQQYAKHGELDTARKLAEDAMLNITKIIGGLVAVEDLAPVQEVYLKEYELAHKKVALTQKLQADQLDLDDLTFDEERHPGTVKPAKLAKAKAKVDEITAQIAALDVQLEVVQKENAALRAQHENNELYQKYEAQHDDGIDLARLNYEEMRQLRRDMQLIFQDPYSSLNPRMSVGQIISEGMVAHKMIRNKGERMQEKVLKIMDDCGLAGYFLHRFPHQFSGGQRQRIGIARALATSPKFVVCDEAVSALDVSIQAQIINLLQDLKEQQDLTYLFITHDLSVVKYISDRIGVMYLGNMVELADSQEIFDNPVHPYTEALLNAIPTTVDESHRELQVLEGDIPSPVNPPKGCKFHTRCAYCTEICKQVVPAWEEVSPNHFVACHHKLHRVSEKEQQG
ncbi:MAG: ATP-binding cassette domain-containing protein [Oscillospiraceae bacterium]|nr:ATP-binding cassette domain-containing protein [Oscillospiraceae bacterium]